MVSVIRSMIEGVSDGRTVTNPAIPHMREGGDREPSAYFTMRFHESRPAGTASRMAVYIGLGARGAGAGR